VIVDGVGTLVDLAGLPGPLTDPNVIAVEWGFFGQNYTEGGMISRRSANNASSLVERVPFSDIGMIGHYLTAYKRRIEHIQQVT